MSGPIHFAWVGGPAVPAFEVLVTGDVWGGSWTVVGNVWGGRLVTTGDIADSGGGFGQVFSNMTNPKGLRKDHQYLIKGPGIPASDDVGGGNDTQLIYDGVNGGGLSQRSKAGIGISVILTNEEDQSTVILGDTRGLKDAAVYDISGAGIPGGTTFTYSSADRDLIFISNPATVTGIVPVKYSSPVGRDVITNLSGDLSGLVDGVSYDVFGQGVAPGTTALWDGTSLTLSTEATVTGFGVTLLLSTPASHPDGGAFDPGVHARDDEDVFSLSLNHTEGNFATLNVVVRNPGTGLLVAARKVWAWISWFNGSSVVPLFHGRLVGVPQAMQGETVTLSFVARPEDYQAQKAALAESMRMLPYWDPIWFSANAANPDTVLEARTQLWHIDRLTLALTASDIIVGEDGTQVVGEGDHLYDRLTASYSAPPLRRIDVTGTVTWTQSASGDIDLTPMLHNAFTEQAATITAPLGDGSPTMVHTSLQHAYPVVSTFTGDGFKSAWPAAGTPIGGGWTVGLQSFIADATWIPAGGYMVRYLAKPAAALASQDSIQGTQVEKMQVQIPETITQLLAGSVTYDVRFLYSSYYVTLPLHYSASRSRSESLRFSLEADVQSVLSEAGALENEAITLSSALIEQPVDAGGAMPIGDLRRNSYFPTDRGVQSFEFLLLLARAKLMARARAVVIKFVTTWQIAAGLSCRWNVQLFDRRLPGGSVIGKVTGYTLTATGGGDFVAEVTIECTVGHGNTLSALPGTNVYVDDYVDPGYEQTAGGQIELLPGELVYQDIGLISVIDDDGVDFFNILPETMVQQLSLFGGPSQQLDAINKVSNVYDPLADTPSLSAGAYAMGFGGLTINNPPPPSNSIVKDPITGAPTISPGPVEALKNNPTRIWLDMVPVEGGAFQSNFYVLTSPLAIPKTIDLESS